MDATAAPELSIAQARRQGRSAAARTPSVVTLARCAAGPGSLCRKQVTGNRDSKFSFSGLRLRLSPGRLKVPGSAMVSITSMCHEIISPVHSGCASEDIQCPATPSLRGSAVLDSEADGVQTVTG